MLQSVAIPPGVGKTHLALALGHLAVDAGYRVSFVTAAELVARCHRAALEGRWATTMRSLAGPGLLIIDELGYLPLPSEGAAALFQVVAQRYLKGSIVLTTNRGIASWGQIFDDPMVAAAMLDRLLHRCSVLQIDGDSYRMRAHRARIQTLRKGVTAHPQRLDWQRHQLAHLRNFGERRQHRDPPSGSGRSHPLLVEAMPQRPSTAPEPQSLLAELKGLGCPG